MTIATSFSSVNSGLWQQLQSQQAQRAADQAIQVASSLQTQARSAKAAAQRAQEAARTLEVNANQAQAQANQALLKAAASQTVGEMQANQAEVYDRLPQMVVQTSPAPAMVPVTAPVATTTASTETIGTVIDTTA